MHYLMPVLAVVASVLSSASACADLGDQLFKLLPNDSAVGPRFGSAVAINQDILIVGASTDDEIGFISGAAYLFDITKNQQLFKLLPKDDAEVSRFGSSVAIGGSSDKEVAIVGSHSGAAYIFDINTGVQLFKLKSEDDDADNQFFGSSVAVSGSLALVGAPLDSDNGNHSGSAYLFDIKSGKLIAKLLANDGSVDDGFGWSVAITGSPGNEVAIIGAFGDDENGSISGSAYIFEANTGKQITKLLADDGAENDWFGISVALSDTTAIVGARRDDDNGSDSGSAYIFDTTSGQQLFKLLANDGSLDDFFGYSVAICGTSAIVGSRHDQDNGIESGSAYLFDTVTGEQIDKLLPKDSADGDRFGQSVAIACSPGKEFAIVGAYFDDNQAGSAYFFDAENTPNKCPWDLDNSGIVGTSDLLALFAQWGTEGSADFDESGAVGTTDLLILFANWGPCK